MEKIARMNGGSGNLRPKHILFCRCRSERINPDFLRSVEEHLGKAGVSVTVLSDFCGLIVQKKELFTDLFRDDADYMVLGCSKRAMTQLLYRVSENAGDLRDFAHINMFATTSDQVISRINDFCAGSESGASYREFHEDSGWPAWFPVIDYRRCTACGQCADFCLFGVYEKREDHVDVINPHSCKNNCPACARICPVSAIIFPKYKNGGAVGGSEEIDEKAEQQRQALDIKDFLGSDIYSALEKRKFKRQSIIREEAMRKALSERDDAMNGIN